MRDIEGYIDRIMKTADLASRDARLVRGELHEHLQNLVMLAVEKGISDEEVMMMVEQEFGNPEELGAAIARAKGRFLTGLKKRARRFPAMLAVCLATGLVLRITVYPFVLEPFKAASDAIAPAVVKGNRVFVNKLASEFEENDVVIYKHGDRKMFGIVKDADMNEGNVVIRRNGETDKTIKADEIVGRAFLQFR